MTGSVRNSGGKAAIPSHSTHRKAALVGDSFT
jgi:hypothetical protein